MAALRVAGIALAVHVSRAEGGEAALLRCHSPPCRRVPAVPGGLRAAGSQAAPVQSSLANPFGQPAQSGYADLVLDVAHAGRFLERGERRDVVGLHRPLSPRRDAADASEARCARALRDPLFPRLRAAAEAIPRAERERTRSEEHTSELQSRVDL